MEVKIGLHRKRLKFREKSWHYHVKSRNGESNMVMAISNNQSSQGFGVRLEVKPI